MDRRTIWAILLMMAIAIVPAIFLKKTPASGAAGQRGSGADSSALAKPSTPVDSSRAASTRDSGSTVASSRDSARVGPTTLPPRGPAAPLQDEIVRVTSPLYTYGISTRGGRLVEATLPRYRSMAPAERGQSAQILPPDSKLLDLTLVLDGRSVPLADWLFKASAETLSIRAPTSLNLSGSRAGLNV